MLKEAQEGVKGGTLAGGSPFAGGPRRPQPLRFTDARGHPAPGGGGTPPLQGGWRNVVRWRWPKERVVEDAVPYGGWETGHVPHNMPRVYPTPGQGSAERGEAGVYRDDGTSRTPSPTGRLRDGPRTA